MTLKFDWVLEVVKIHVCAKFYQAKCSSSSVIVSPICDAKVDLIQQSVFCADRGTLIMREMKIRDMKMRHQK